MHWRTWMDSPVGRLQLIATDDGLSAVLWEGEDGARIGLGPVRDRDDHPLLQQAVRQLQEYFAGDRKVFDLPMDAVGTAFQKDVWAALRAIPYGETRSYGDIARLLGRPKAFRAVGAANGRNPLSIVSPCHRVIATGGGLGGFAGGLEVKSRLLAMERSDRA